MDAFADDAVRWEMDRSWTVDGCERQTDTKIRPEKVNSSILRERGGIAKFDTNLSGFTRPWWIWVHSYLTFSIPWIREGMQWNWWTNASISTMGVPSGGKGIPSGGLAVNVKIPVQVVHMLGNV